MERAQGSSHDPSSHILVVGTGFAGLGMGIRLKKMGIETFTILDEGEEVGGTWRDNHYPGAACDVQSHLYSFSFEPNPHWSRQFAEQSEIYAYMRHCARKYGLYPHIRFGSRVVSARFDERAGLWTVETSKGERFVGRALISGTGGLSKPSYPDIPGLGTFEKKAFHSARWDHSFDYRGKRVAVIGTGASAIQIVPELAKSAARVDLYQRTPPWILPKPDRAIGAAEKALYSLAPAAQWLHRQKIYWQNELTCAGFVVDPRILGVAERMALSHLSRAVKDPALREQLTPKYHIGCKRILLSNDYYPALQRPNVSLCTGGVAEVTKDAVVGKDGVRREVDAIVLCTGFSAAEQVAPFPVVGRGGVRLDEEWEPGAEAYLGTVVSGFTNFFTIVGPNTGLGHSSMIYMIESQIEYIAQCLEVLRERRLRYLDVKPEVQADHNVRLHARMAKTVWQTGCRSWYQTSTGKNTTLWPGFTFEFRWATRRPDLTCFELAPELAVEARERARATNGRAALA